MDWWRRSPSPLANGRRLENEETAPFSGTKKYHPPRSTGRKHCDAVLVAHSPWARDVPYAQRWTGPGGRILMMEVRDTGPVQFNKDSVWRDVQIPNRLRRRWYAGDVDCHQPFAEGAHHDRDER
jgi:hypothetical protein